MSEYVLMTQSEQRAKQLLQDWVNKQSHERCWYYPEIFRELCQLFEVTQTVQSDLPPRPEFERGCARYQNEEFGTLVNPLRGPKN